MAISVRAAAVRGYAGRCRTSILRRRNKLAKLGRACGKPDCEWEKATVGENCRYLKAAGDRFGAVFARFAWRIRYARRCSTTFW
jgi:hypothetical protein